MSDAGREPLADDVTGASQLGGEPGSDSARDPIAESVSTSANDSGFDIGTGGEGGREGAIPANSVVVNGVAVAIGDGAGSLLDLLRDECRLLSVKDGCSPQGQCGCCTVLVDGKPRVACVTPAKRVRGRAVTTLEGLDSVRRKQWGDAFCQTGGSQCGFCTPGIIMRLDGIISDRASSDRASSDSASSSGGSESLPLAVSLEPVVDQALLAHLCRCTGWQTIHETVNLLVGGVVGEERDLDAASRRATIESHGPQMVSPDVALGQGGFSADTAPADALVAVTNAEGEWVVAETLTEARQLAGKIQGRRTTISHSWPLEVPPGEWVRTLRTTWVDPAYLETDASWCRPGGEPSSLVENGGAFGGKVSDSLGLGLRARQLADEQGRSVLVLASREETASLGPKRPPVAAGIRQDGSGVVRVVATPGIVEAISSVAPSLEIEEVAVPGPPTSAALRGAGWVEASVLQAGLVGEVGVVRSPAGAEATAAFSNGVLRVGVRCGEVLDATVLRSYCIGAAHMAWSWLTSEALTVDDSGVVHDLTVRSFGILRSADMPPVEVEIHPDCAAPINGSDAVFAAVASAGWAARGFSQDWPIEVA